MFLPPNRKCLNFRLPSNRKGPIAIVWKTGRATIFCGLGEKKIIYNDRRFCRTTVGQNSVWELEWVS